MSGWRTRSSTACLAVISVVASIGPLQATDRVSLLDASKSGNREEVRRLLKAGADPNVAQGDGATALFWAAYHDDVEMADLLIRAGAKVSAANDLGATPLWIASMNASAPMTNRLLQAGANSNAALLSGETPLMVAARSGGTEVVRLLLAKGAKVNATATRGQTALMWAVAQTHPDVVKVLLAHGADVRMTSEEWAQVMAVPPHGMLEYNRSIPHGRDTALMFAARVGDLASARLLVEAGANVNDADAWGVSATALAAHSGFRDVVDYLLEKGADPNRTGAGFTALHAAIMRRDERMVSALLAHGADPNEPVRSWTPTRRSSRDWNFGSEFVGATPYWLAARVTSPAIMRQLVDRGANPKVVHHVEYHAESGEKRSQTTTPLMAAAGMGGGLVWTPVERGQRETVTLESVRLALDLGADVNAANDDGRTALDAANALKFPSVVNFLVEHGAKPGTVRTRSRVGNP